MKNMILPLALVTILAGADARGQDADMSSSGSDASMMGGLAGKSSTRILRLEKMDAEATAKMLKELIGPGERVTAYSRINCLVIHATDEQHKQIEKLLKQLGELVAKNPNTTEPRMDFMGDDGSFFESTTKPTGINTRGSLLSPTLLKQRFASSEKRADELAALLRESTKNSKGNSKEIENLEKRLRESVTESFQYRQDQHRAEIAQLEARIQKMKSMLDARDKIKKEIIDRRVADLKNPTRRWDSAEKKTSVPPTPMGPMAQPVRLHGVVTAVRDKDKFVEISIGADDGIKKGMTFIVIRKGLHVGRAEVIEVVPKRAIGRVMREELKLAPVQVGDLVEFPARAEVGSPIGLPGPVMFPRISGPGPGVLPGNRMRRTNPFGGSRSGNRESRPFADERTPELMGLLRSWTESAAKVNRLEGSAFRFVIDRDFKVEKWSMGNLYYAPKGKLLVNLKPREIPKFTTHQHFDESGEPYKIQSDRAEQWISDGKQIWQLDPEARQAHVFSVPEEDRGQNIIWPEPLALVLPTQKLFDGYRVRLRGERNGGQEAIIELAPRQQDARSPERLITVILDKLHYFPTTVEVEDGTVKTVFSFINLRSGGAEPDWVKTEFPEASKTFRPSLTGYDVDDHLQSSQVPGSEPNESAGKTAFSTMSPELQTLLKAWSQTASTTKGIEGTLQRIIYDQSFRVEKRETGKFYFEAPAKTAVDLRPAKTHQGGFSELPKRWIRDANKIWLVGDDKKRIQVSPSEAKHDSRLTLGLLPPLFISPSAIVEGPYHVVLARDNDKQAEIDVTPREELDAATWRKVTILFDKDLKLPKAMKFVISVKDPKLPKAVDLEMVYGFTDLHGCFEQPDWIEQAFGVDVFPSPSGTSQLSPAIQLKLTGPKTATVLWTDSNKIPSSAVILPGRINVPSNGEAIFELDNLPGHAGLTLFGSFKNHAESPAAKTHLRHNAVGVEFVEEDVKQAAAGNLVTKAYYIPEDASTVDTIVSTKVDPGVDVLTEAKRRGDLVGVLRLGNRDGDIGENEDWHEKFLKGHLKRLDLEREAVKEELAIYEDTLIELEADAKTEPNPELKEKITEFKAKLAAIEERKKVYEQKIQQHADAKGKAKAEKPVAD